MTMATPRLLLASIIFAMIGSRASGAADTHLPNLKISPNKRFLVTADGKPFFWLGDTAWELFHRADRRRQTTIWRRAPPRGSR